MTDRKPVESTSDPLGWSLIRVLGPQFWDTVYISEVNGAKKVKSDAQVAMDKNPDPVKIFSLRDGWGTLPPTQFFFKLLEFSETSRTRKLIFGLQVIASTDHPEPLTGELTGLKGSYHGVNGPWKGLTGSERSYMLVGVKGQLLCNFTIIFAVMKFKLKQQV